MKVQVQMLRSVQESVSVEFTVLARDVKEAMELDRDDDWHDYVEEYLNEHRFAEIDEAAETETVERTVEEWEIEKVEE